MDLLKQTVEYDMNAVEIFARSLNLSVNLLGQVLLQKWLVARVPVAKNVFDKGDQAAVAFNVRLLPQKIDEPVVSGGKLIHRRGDRPQLPLCADLGEIDRKYSKELLHQVVGGQDIGIQEPGDILLEKIRIPNENPFNFRLMIRAERSFLVHLGFREIISSQERMF